MEIERWVKNGVLVGIFAIPFVALVVPPFMFFPFIGGKNFAFRILVELMLGGFVLLAYLNSAYRPKRSWLFYAFVSFVGVIAIADIFGEHLFKSFWSNFERMEGLITLLHLFAYFVVTAAVLNTEKLWTKFWQTNIGVSVILALYGLMQWGGMLAIHQSGTRLDATLGNATYLAIYMVFHIFITTLLLVRHKGDAFVRYVYGSVIALQVLILFLTETRGAILGFGGGVLLSGILIALFNKENKTLRKLAIGAIAVVFVFSGLLYALKDTEFVQGGGVFSRLSTISLEAGAPRFAVWNTAWQGVKERPVLGWGQENFSYVFNKYYDPSMYAQEQWFDRVHNIIGDWLIAGGVLGLLAYLSLFVAVLYYLWFYRRRDSAFSSVDRALLTGLLAAYFFHNLFVFDNITSYILFISILAYIAWKAHSREENPLSVSGTSQTRAQHNSMHNNSIHMSSLDASKNTPILGGVAFVLTLFIVYFLSGKGFMANLTLLSALSPKEEGPIKNLELFEKAYAYNTLGRQEAAEQLMSAGAQVAGADESQAPAELKEAYLLKGKEIMEMQLKRKPDDARLELFYATFLRSFGQTDEALVHSNRAYELSPSKQGIGFDLVQHHLRIGEYEDAYILAKKIFESEKRFDTARTIYAMTAVYAGHGDIAEAVLTEKYGTDLVADENLIKAYADNGKYDKVIDIRKKQIEGGDNTVERWIQLAAAYLANNQRTESISAIEKAIEINAEFKEQGEYLIGEIRAGRNP
jgi:O-antigen ligase